MTQWLGIDVGGANIKLANGCGYACSKKFELWRHPEHLASTLSASIAEAPRCDAIAVTMTGELADCYATKREGVAHILDSLVHSAVNRPIAVYCLDGVLRTAEEVSNNPLVAAASNWHALGSYVARIMAPQPCMAIDIGSTTTDFTPIIHGTIASDSTTDLDRLVAGELVYTGLSRTPVCAVADWLPYRDRQVPIAAEFFSTMADVYTLLGWIVPDDHGSADGRTFSQMNCVRRLAHQICIDSETFDLEDALIACRHLHQCQMGILRARLTKAMASFQDDSLDVVISGSGEQLAESVAQAVLPSSPIVRLSERIGKRQSTCAAAYAVAVLAAEASL